MGGYPAHERRQQPHGRGQQEQLGRGVEPVVVPRGEVQHQGAEGQHGGHVEAGDQEPGRGFLAGDAAQLGRYCRHQDGQAHEECSELGLQMLGRTLLEGGAEACEANQGGGGHLLTKTPPFCQMAIESCLKRWVPKHEAQRGNPIEAESFVPPKTTVVFRFFQRLQGVNSIHSELILKEPPLTLTSEVYPCEIIPKVLEGHVVDLHKRRKKKES